MFAWNKPGGFWTKPAPQENTNALDHCENQFVAQLNRQKLQPPASLTLYLYTHNSPCTSCDPDKRTCTSKLAKQQELVKIEHKYLAYTLQVNWLNFY